MKKAAILVIAMLAAVGLLIWQQSRAAPFHVSGMIETDEIRVGSRVGGRVKSVHVAEGQEVAPGELLVTLDPFDLNERLGEARAVLAARTAVLEKLKAGYRDEEIAQAAARQARLKALLEQLTAGPRPLEIKILEDKLAAADAERVNAEQEYHRVRKLFDAGSSNTEEMNDAQRAYDVAGANQAIASDTLALAREGTRREEIAQARANLLEAEHGLALLKSGSRSEDVSEAAARVAGAEASLAAIERRISELEIRAPIACVVEAIDLRPGDLIAPNAPVVSLLDASKLWIRAYVPENRLDLTLGQRVSVRIDSFPDRRFSGEISFVSRAAEFIPSNAQTPEERSKQVFRIKVNLRDGLDVLRAGMSADVYTEPGE